MVATERVAMDEASWSRTWYLQAAEPVAGGCGHPITYPQVAVRVKLTLGSRPWRIRDQTRWLRRAELTLDSMLVAMATRKRCW